MDKSWTFTEKFHLRNPIPRIYQPSSQWRKKNRSGFMTGFQQGVFTEATNVCYPYAIDKELEKRLSIGF